MKKYSYDACLEKASQYKTRSQFYNHDTSYYAAAWRYGWLDEICRHMNHNDYSRMSFEECLQEAKKYQYRTDFRKGSEKAYLKCWRQGWLDEVCSHMEHKTRGKHV